MGGDAPKNRKQEYKKQQRREGGDGGRDEKKRTGDGKPVTVKGMTYQKQQPSFISKMLARDAESKRRAARDNKVDLSQVLPTMMDRAAKGAAVEQWPSRGDSPSREAEEGPPRREETAEETAVRLAAERTQAERAAFMAAQVEQERAARKREEQLRYDSGRGVQAASGQMRVIFNKRPASSSDGAGAGSAAAESAGAGDETGVPTTKKRKKKKPKANKSLLSFGDGEDE